MDSVLGLRDLVPPDLYAEADKVELRRDPLRCLYRYTFTPQGGDVRHSWSLPDTAVRHLEVSQDGCRKKRDRLFGDNKRNATFFSFCESASPCARRCLSLSGCSLIARLRCLRNVSISQAWIMGIAWGGTRCLRERGGGTHS